MFQLLTGQYLAVARWPQMIHPSAGEGTCQPEWIILSRLAQLWHDEFSDGAVTVRNKRYFCCSSVTAAAPITPTTKEGICSLRKSFAKLWEGFGKRSVSQDDPFSVLWDPFLQVKSPKMWMEAKTCPCKDSRNNDVFVLDSDVFFFKANQMLVTHQHISHHSHQLLHITRLQAALVYKLEDELWNLCSALGQK